MDSPRTPSTRTLQSLGIPESEHQAWLQAFRPEVQSEQLEEDHSAWYAVTGLLLFIVGIGVSLAIYTVYACLSA